MAFGPPAFGYSARPWARLRDYGVGENTTLRSATIAGYFPRRQANVVASDAVDRGNRWGGAAAIARPFAVIGAVGALIDAASAAEPTRSNGLRTSTSIKRKFAHNLEKPECRCG